jgi:RecA-family ATPase
MKKQQIDLRMDAETDTDGTDEKNMAGDETGHINTTKEGSTTNGAQSNGTEPKGSATNGPFIPLVQILTERHENEQAWRDKWINHPKFPYLVIGRSLEVGRNEAENFFTSAEKGSAGLHKFMLNRAKFPKIESLNEMLDQAIPENPEIVIGIVREGCKMVIGGPSKGRKTWILMDFAASVATGSKWIGFDTNKGKILYVNFELFRHSFRKRIRQIVAAKGLDEKEVERNLNALNFRECETDAINAEGIISRVIEVAEHEGYSAIILDPTYKKLGDWKENESGDMAKLMREFSKLSSRLGAAVVFAAHFPKGNMNKRESIDRIGGSGVFARDPDAIITMTELSKNEYKQAFKGPKERKKSDELSVTQIDVLGMLEAHLSHGDWMAASATLKIDKSKFNRILKKLKEFELIDQKEDGFYFRTEKGEALVADRKAKMAAEDPDDDDKVEESKEVKPLGNAVFKLEFTLRDAPPQKTIAIQFGDWMKGDYVHHRVEVELKGFESGEECEEGEGQEGSPCIAQYFPGGVYVSCLNGKHGIEGHAETKAKSGDTLKWCLASLDETCPCGGRHHVRK